jgi:hypothetical protein
VPFAVNIIFRYTNEFLNFSQSLCDLKAKRHKNKALQTLRKTFVLFAVNVIFRYTNEFLNFSQSLCDLKAKRHKNKALQTLRKPLRTLR